MPRPDRHALLAVDADDWQTVVATAARGEALSVSQVALLRGWGDRGWPVVARRGPGACPAAVPVGVPLPPSAGKARIALELPFTVMWRRRASPSLDTSRGVAPAGWRTVIDALIALGRETGAPPRPFGALLWQAMTGMSYLHEASDLDLLWPLVEGTALRRLLDGIARIEAAGPVRIDGEVLTPEGGVHWRELAMALASGAGAVVLAKTSDGAALVEVDRIFVGGASGWR